MKSFCRKTYNSEYYSQNRERLLLQRRVRKQEIKRREARTEDIQLSLFERSNQWAGRSNGFKCFNVENLINGLLCLLVILNSYFLLSEAVEFYRVNNWNAVTSVMAAVIVELLLIALSAVRARTFFLKLCTKTVLILLFLYSSWSFSSNAFGKGFGGLDQLNMIEKQIESIERRINERRDLIQENVKIHRITAARKMILEKDDLSAELLRLEKDRASRVVVSASAQKINICSMIVLRLLIQLANIIVIHHLSSSARRRRRQSTERRTITQPGIRLVP